MRVFIAILFMLTAAFLPMYFVQNQSNPAIPMQVDSLYRVRIVAAGDLMIHKPQITAARQTNGEYDFSKSFKYVEPYFKNADLSIINLETTLKEQAPYTGYPCFSSPIATAEAIKQMGVDVVSLANNHCCDKGRNGIKTTLKVLDSLGINRLGVFKDSLDYNDNNILYLKLNSISFAIVNYTYGTNGMPVPKGMIVNNLDTISMARDFKKIARDSVDCLIAVVHWGNEYERQPNKAQKCLEKFMRRHGVDVILGSHPHVVQTVEVDSIKGVTLWSMGNFISNQRKRYCDGGIIGVIDIEKVGKGPLKYELDVIPIWVRRQDYEIIPQAIGDTLPMSDNDKMLFKRFITDTENILSQSVYI